MTRLGFLLLSIFSVSISWSQNSYEVGFLPALNFNKKISEKWSINSRIESRSLLASGSFGAGGTRDFNYRLTDFSLVSAKKIGLNSRVAGGYLLRIEDGTTAHRFMQQYVIIQKFTNFRLAHRFLTDQTFSSVESPDFRLRYRITFELPLNGQSVDPKEFYIRMNHEYVNGWQGGSYDLEMRFVPTLGYDFNDSFRLEAGLDYRVDGFINSATEHTFWSSIGIFVEL